MFKKRNLVLFLILAILVGVAYYLTSGIPWLDGAKKFFPKFSQEMVTSIVIQTSEGVTRLERKNNGWVVSSAENAPADGDRVDDVLRNTTELSREELISTNPLNQSNFKVDGSGARVQLFKQEDILADYYVGHVGPDFYSTYVRKEGEDKVYLVYRVLTSVVQPLDWRDLTVLDFIASEVTSVGVEFQGEKFVLEKEDNRWIIEGQGSKDIDAKTVQEFVWLLSSLKAEDLQMDASEGETGLDKTDWRYAVNLSDGMIYELKIGNQAEDGNYYAKTNKSIVTYLIAAVTVNKLPTTSTDF